MRNVPDEATRTRAVKDIVHDYANLVSSGHLCTTPLPAPINTHVEQAFLINCRKFYGFFTNTTFKDDMLASDFGSVIPVALPTWIEWGPAINTQLAHISYARVTHSKSWDGTAKAAMLTELRKAWADWRTNLDEPYKTELTIQIGERATRPEYADLDLHK